MRYIASLSPRFDWTAICVTKGKSRELGVKPNSKKSELVVPILDSNGKTLGQIEIQSGLLNVFSPEVEKIVRRVAAELGELWPE